MQNPLRDWIIAGLTHKPLPALSNVKEHFDMLSELMIEVAENEGVLLLLEYQLQSHPQRAELPKGWMQNLQAACQQSLFDQLAMLAEQAKVFEALHQTNSDFLVLKGGALAHWLYAKPHLRVVTDLDILLPSKQAVLELEQLLSGLGYSPTIINSIANELPYRKPGGPYEFFSIDAHWKLFNRTVLGNLLSYQELFESSQILPNTPGVKGLSLEHALINACGHRVLSLPHRQLQNIQRADSLRWLWDIHLLALGFNELQWQNLLKISKDKKISAIIFDSLQQVQIIFGTEIPKSILTLLEQQKSVEPMAMSWFTSMRHYQWREFLASNPSWKGRISWLMQRIWPNPESVRERYGSDDPVWKFMFKRFWVGIKRLLS